MKKLAKILTSLFVVLVSIFTFGAFAVPSTSASATELQSQSAFETDIMTVLNEYVTYTDRVAGTDGEKNASEYIRNYLSTQTSLTAKNNAYITDGVQTFSFGSIFTSLYETSQNIIFEYNSGNEGSKKVIIGCHYDAVAFALNENQVTENIVESESVTGSAGSVATLLVLAKYLPSLNLNYDVEIVFFGAGESNNAGSNFYLQGISSEDKENILCYINFDSIAVGKYTYFYVDEVDNSLFDLISNVASTNGTSTSKVNTFNLNKVLLDSQNELGLSYTHIALSSDNFNFMKNGITSINFFAGDYSYGVSIGRNEYESNEIVAYTENDNLAHIFEIYGEDAVINNLYNIYRTVCLTLTDSNLESAITSTQNSMNWFYMFFGNDELVLYLTVVVFILFIIIALYIYHKLEIKSYYANVEKEFLTTVVQISEQINGNGIDENVAKAVSQVVARDIKKAKTIKSKNNKDNNKE